MSDSVWANIWDTKIEEYANTIHHDTKYKIEKRVIIFWYCFSYFPNWEICFNRCDDDYITPEWKQKIDNANEKIEYDIKHWAKTMEQILRKCANTIKPEGNLVTFVSEVFKKEPKSVCEPTFLYLLYLSLYNKDPEESAREVVSSKKIRRDTFDSISSFRKNNPQIDVSSLFSICAKVYTLK